METAILKINRLTDKLNGYGMPIIEVDSSIYFEAPNVGNNIFVPTCNFDETDLLRLRTMFNTQVIDMVMLEVKMPNRHTTKPIWYSLVDHPRVPNKTNLLF